MTRMPCRGRIGCKICYLEKTVLFIVNPKAGKGRNLDLDNLARQNLDSRCFKWSVANANQWGNNARIAPCASTTDGLFDITIVKPFSFLAAAPLAFRLFSGSIDKDRRVMSLKARKVTIVRDNPGWAHFDGDPVMLGESVAIELFPAKLKIIA